MIDAASALRAEIPNITIDAEVNRSALRGPELLSASAAAGTLGASIVFDLGLNGGFTENVLNHVLELAAGRRVVMVTNHCPHCQWTPKGNAIKRAQCVPERQCFLADFDALAAAHPDWFTRDGVHMPIGGAGAVAYARLVRSKL
jgi:hypothetical protein